MCFPSIAPMQFGKFHFVLNWKAMLSQSACVVGTCVDRESIIYTHNNNLHIFDCIFRIQKMT